MEFRWIDWNLGKVASHGVEPGEAEHVVETAEDPYPQHREDDKFLVWVRRMADGCSRSSFCLTRMTRYSSFTPGR